MSRTARVTAEFGDGTYEFRLAIDELVELQEKCDAGPPLILARLEASQWKVEDVRETIRLGLIGGGMKPLDALARVKLYVDQRPDWLNNATVARGILSVALVGCEEDPPGKPEGEAAAENQPSPMANGDSPRSTEAPASSDKTSAE